jgi:hypothetical protein
MHPRAQQQQQQIVEWSLCFAFYAVKEIKFHAKDDDVELMPNQLNKDCK